MNKLIWLIILLVWLLLGAWCFSTFLCYSKNSFSAEPNTSPLLVVDSTVTSTTLKSSLVFLDENTNVKITFPECIRFVRSKFSPINLNKNMYAVLEQTADHLIEYPTSILIVTGYFNDSEQNSSSLSDLGLARANALKKKLITLGAIPTQIEINSKQIPKTFFENTILKKGIDFNFKLN